MRLSTRWLAAAVPLWFLVGGCQAAPGPLDGEPLFVAVSRGDSTSGAMRAGLTVAGVPAPTDESFYVAINKKALGDRFFLSAFLEQSFPGGVGSGAARSLGTRVVTMRVQNDKLFLFDTSDAKKTSDTFDPSLLYEAYPIVRDYWQFNGWTNADHYLLIDPSAGLNHFSLLSDSYATGSSPGHFQIDLSYLQHFRALDDGAAWQQIFTGLGDQFDASSGSMGEPNEFRGSGTLSLALRRYQEGAGFSPAPLPPKELYFRSDLRLVANQGGSIQNAIKWNIHPGMKPIEWLISPQIAALANDPAYQAYDILGAVKNGIEGWNSVFGFPVLTARVADPNDAWSDDDHNYLVFDADPTYGYAFANWRTNPNTGEVRGASVYFNGVWLQGLDRFTDDTGAVMSTPAPKPSARLVWAAMPEERLCDLPAPQFRDPMSDDGSLPAPSAATVKLTGKEKAERYITHTILHEIGHTLGLRHNFKGSLVPPASSVMDYILDDDGIQTPVPQHYDIAAIQYLYGLAATTPTDAFCTDENTTQDPDCARFDRTANPLEELYIPTFQGVLGDYLSLKSSTPPNVTMNNVLAWVRAGSAAQRQIAWKALIGPLHAPVDPATLAATPGTGARIDNATRRLFSRLWVDDPKLRGQFTKDPPQDPAWIPLVLAELRGNLLNLDGVRSFPTRRLCVDLLKKQQSQPAYDTLVEARAHVATERNGLTGADQALADDLLARIDAAIHPYFN